MKTYAITDLFYTEWEQLTHKQILAIIELTDAHRHSEPGSRKRGLIEISILRTLRKNKRLVSKIEVDQAVDCFNDLTFLSRKPNGSFRTPWYFFPIIIRGNKFCAPQIKGGLPMFDRSFQQLVYADSAFSAFCVLNHKYQELQSEHAPKDELRQCEKEMDEAVNALIAVLYISPEYFNIADVDDRAQFISAVLENGHRTLILHTYSNVRHFITQRCPELFQLPLYVDENAEAENDEAPTFTGPMWMNLRYDLAKTEVFKGFDVASNARIYDALDFLEKEAIESTRKKQKANG